MLDQVVLHAVREVFTALLKIILNITITYNVSALKGIKKA
jgi:hypothetical protein